MVSRSHTLDSAAQASAPLLNRASRLFASLASFGATARIKASAGLRGMQTMRMMSVLADMSDHQLAEIGISRSDIPKYAEHLTAAVEKTDN